MTIYGQGGEQLQFCAFDELEGTIRPIVEVHDFTADIKGTEQAPCLFHLGETIPTDIADITKGVIPHISVEGYYSLNGQRMNSQGTPQTAGLYIVKYADGSFRKIYIK